MLFITLISVVSIEQIQANVSLQSLVKCTNDIREEHQVFKLQNSRLLNFAAQQKANDMEAFKYWAHQNPYTGEYAWKFIKEAGYTYKEAGENLAIGFSLGQHICEAWAASPTHFSNLVSKEYQEVGFARKNVDLGSEKGILVVQLFGSRSNFIANPNNESYLDASILSSSLDNGAIIISIFTLAIISSLGLSVLRKLE